jgi:phage tail sheath protein FI
MAEYVSPGVYIEEFEIGSKPIEGVSTSTAGFLGETERGPTAPVIVNSLLEYQRIFGGFFGDAHYVPFAVQGFFENGGSRCFIGRIVKTGSGTATLSLAGARGAGARTGSQGKTALTIDAVGEGTWGNRIAVKVADGSKKPEDQFRLSIFYWKDCVPRRIYDPQMDTTSQPRPCIIELFDDLSTDKTSPDYYEKKINGNSSLVRLTKKAENDDTGEKPGPCSLTFLSGGTDGAGTIDGTDYERPETRQSDNRKGLTAFEEIDEIAILYAPNATAVSGLNGKVIAHCENLKDRFAIIDSPKGQKDVSHINPRSTLSSRYAAYYYPWIKIISGTTEMVIPPGGHIAGIYARSDNERGVHKAPANEVVHGASDPEFAITKGEHGILNPRGVNVIRKFPRRGILVCGARTLSEDPLWKYINVRRLFNYLEKSIDEGTQWVVFEPNNEKLWARVRATITQFLMRVWHDGALMGTKPEEAFFVKCDRTTMSLDDIDNGRLVCIIGVAPLKPAEFYIFRFAQWQGGSAVTE